MKPFTIILSALLIVLPTLVFAQDNFLVGIPGVPSGGSGDFNTYINAVYVLFISIAALLAVVKIIIAGVKYMFTDIVTQKGEAKKDIQGALLGLLIVLSAVLILTIINPELTRFNLDANQVGLPDAPPLSVEEGTIIEDYCNSVEGNCDIRTCDALGDYTVEIMLAGAAVGTAVPVGGTVLGALVGGASALYLQSLGSEAECQAVCYWFSGEVQTINGTNSCLFPEDAVAARQFEIEARRQELREEYDCLDGRLILLGGEFSNCIRDLSSVESELILSALEVDPTSSVAETILNRIENSQIQNILVSDNNTIRQLTESIGVDRTLLAITLPPATGANTGELTNISTQFENICRDAGFDYDYSQIGVTQYIVCAE